MTDLTHALRAISESLKDRAKVALIDNQKPDRAALLQEFGGAFEDAADSLEHRWRERNQLATGQPTEGDD